MGAVRRCHECGGDLLPAEPALCEVCGQDPAAVAREILRRVRVLRAQAGGRTPSPPASSSVRAAGTR